MASKGAPSRGASHQAPAQPAQPSRPAGGPRFRDAGRLDKQLAEYRGAAMQKAMRAREKSVQEAETRGRWMPQPGDILLTPVEWGCPRTKQDDANNWFITWAVCDPGHIGYGKEFRIFYRIWDANKKTRKNEPMPQIDAGRLKATILAGLPDDGSDEMTQRREDVESAAGCESKYWGPELDAMCRAGSDGNPIAFRCNYRIVPGKPDGKGGKYADKHELDVFEEVPYGSSLGTAVAAPSAPAQTEAYGNELADGADQDDQDAPESDEYAADDHDQDQDDGLTEAEGLNGDELEGDADDAPPDEPVQRRSSGGGGGRNRSATAVVPSRAPSRAPRR